MSDELIPPLSETRKDYDFSNELVEGDKKRWTSWFWVKRGLYVCYVYETKKYQYLPLREDEKNGLCFWDSESKAWRPYSEKVQGLYSAYKAEEAILK